MHRRNYSNNSGEDTCWFCFSLFFLEQREPLGNWTPGEMICSNSFSNFFFFHSCRGISRVLKVLKNSDEKPSVPWALFNLNLRMALEISYSLINSSRWACGVGSIYFLKDGGKKCSHQLVLCYVVTEMEIAFCQVERGAERCLCVQWPGGLCQEAWLWCKYRSLSLSDNWWESTQPCGNLSDI